MLIATRGRPLAALTVLTVLLALSGCGEPKGQVTGTVTYKGAKVTSGQINAVGKSGQPYSAEIQSDGTYTLAGLPYGDYRLTVARLPKDHKDPAEVEKVEREKMKKAAEKGEEYTPPAVKHDIATTLPKRYAALETTDLKVTVDKAEVTLPLTLAD